MACQIQKIIKVQPYQLVLAFNNGELRMVDLAQKIEEWGADPDSKFAELKEPEMFKSVKLNEEIGALYWPNGLDLCPDVLYELSTRPKDSKVQV
jgi:hypothetical protein